MPTSRPDSTAPDSGLPALGDPDDNGDFASEHEQFVVDGGEEADRGEQESQERYIGGLDGEGPP